MNKFIGIFTMGALALATARAEAAPLQVRQVFVGDWHACAIFKDRRIKCWGENSRGQLGLGDRENRGDEPDEMGNDLPFVDLGDVQGVRQLALGRDHTCALSGTNLVRCWGGNAYGQLGLEDTDDRGDGPDEMGTRLRSIRVTETESITSIVAGSEHTCVLIEDGSVKCWGRNQYGQLGLGNEDNFGDDWMELLPNIQVDLAGRRALQIAAGYAHTCALLEDETVRCWGLNDSGQLGIGSTFERGNAALEMGSFLDNADIRTGYGPPIAIDAGSTHTCVLFEAGRVTCWGGNADGQLALGHPYDIGDASGEMGLSILPIDFGSTFDPVTAIASGGFHNCALGATGVKCWGQNISGQLGNGSGSRDSVGDETSELGYAIDEVDLGNDAIVEIDTAWLASCARFLNQRIKCWGSAVSGIGGLEDAEKRGVEADSMGSALPYIDLGNDGQR